MPVTAHPTRCLEQRVRVACRGSVACGRTGAVLTLLLALAACGGDDDTAAASAGTQPPAPAVPAPAPPPASAALTISRTAPAACEWDDLAVGKAVHIDVAEAFTAVPGEYRGLKFLRTADADKFLSAANAIEFETNRDVAVIVAYDSKATSRPAWLASWTDTGDSLTSSLRSYRLHRKQFASGMVTLGGNELGASSYIVVVDDGSAVGNSAPTITGTALARSPPRSSTRSSPRPATSMATL